MAHIEDTTTIDAKEDANTATGVAIIDEDVLRGKIHEVRGQKVMLDFELAEIYGYTTKAFNQQVRRNTDKFDVDFMFTLSADEEQTIRSQFVTGSHRNERYPMNAFTEQGVYMLMTVLKGELATRQSKALIRLFKRLKDYALEGRGFVGRDELDQVKERISVLENGASDLGKSLARVEREVGGIVAGMSEAVRRSSLAAVADGFASVAHDGLPIGAGEPATADLAYREVYSLARESVLVVDDYIGLKTLMLLSAVGPGVKVTVCSDNRGRGLRAFELADFRREFPGVDVELRASGGAFHDRYVALDLGADSERLFHCGASSKDAGLRVTTVVELRDPAAYRGLLEGLLANPLLELP